MKVEPMTIGEQIKRALDGRTQRWLSFKIEVPEGDLSKKLNGSLDFTDEEIAKINTVLNSKVKIKK